MNPRRYRVLFTTWYQVPGSFNCCSINFDILDKYLDGFGHQILTFYRQDFIEHNMSRIISLRLPASALTFSHEIHLLMCTANLF